MRQSFNDAVYSMLQLVPEQERRQAYERFVYESAWAAFEIGYWPLDPRRASRVDETKVTCPVLVVGAGQDKITPASVVRRVARKYRRVSTYKEFSNHAHWVVGEPGWEEVAEYVLLWLRSQRAQGYAQATGTSAAPAAQPGPTPEPETSVNAPPP